MDDHALLREFVRSRSETAFRELVDRHLGMVYSAACRMVRDPHLAEDVAQSVFLTLAQKAAEVGTHQVIAGWLHNTTRNLAMHAVRSELRRREREQTAVAMQLHEAEPPTDWILEHLESAMEELEANDRDVIVLRYLEGRPLGEVGAEFGISEDAARMRVNRALERLRVSFAAKDAVVTTALVATALSTGSTTAVPIGLAAAVTSSAVAGSAVAASWSAVLSWFSLKTAAVLAVAAALVGVSTHLLRQRAQVPLPSPEASQTLAALPGNPAPPAQTVVLPDGSQSAEREVSPDAALITGDTGGSSSANTGGVRATSPPAGSPPARRMPGPAEMLNQQAIELLRHRRYEDALALLDRALQIKTNFAVAYLFRGNVFDGLQQPDAALTNYTRTIEFRPDMFQGWFQRSRIYDQLQQYDAVVSDCDEAIRLNPDFWQAFLGRGRAKFNLHQYAAALKDLDRVVELNPQWTEAYDLRAQLDWREGRKDEALANRRQAVAVEPQNARLLYLLGDTLQQMSLYTESLSALTRSIELDPADADAWRSRGDAKTALHQTEAAINDFTAYLRMQPQNTAYVSRRGLAYLQLGVMDKARTDFDRAIRMLPNRADYFENRAQVLLRLGKQEEAKVDFDRAVALRSNTTAKTRSN